MKKYITLLILTIVFIILIINPNILIISVNDAIDLFINKLFVSMFPFFVLSEILLNYNFHYYVSSLTKNIFVKLFKINSISSSIIILSILTGHPSNAKYITDYLKLGLINENEATKLLIFTFFPSPVFVITVVGYMFFNSIKIGLVILLIIYLTNFLLGIFIRNKIKVNIIDKNDLIISEPRLLGFALKNAIINSINTLIIILGNVIVFTIIINLINNYFNFNTITEGIISSIIELTSGTKKISFVTDFNIKFTMFIFALTFCGLSIHSQVSSIISDFNINYKLIIKYRFIASIISSIIIFILLKLI